MDNVKNYSSKAETLDAIFRSNIEKYSDLLANLRNLNATRISISKDTNTHINQTEAQS
jgi:hypothetical protein